MREARYAAASPSTRESSASSRRSASSRKSAGLTLPCARPLVLLLDVGGALERHRERDEVGPALRAPPAPPAACARPRRRRSRPRGPRPRGRPGRARSTPPSRGPRRKSMHLLGDDRSIGRQLHSLERVERPLDRRRDREVVAAVEQDPEDADGRAAEAERVGGAGGLLPHPDDADELVKTIAERRRARPGPRVASPRRRRSACSGPRSRRRSRAGTPRRGRSGRP